MDPSFWQRQPHVVTSAVSFSSLIDMGKLKKSALTMVFLAQIACTVHRLSALWW